MSDKGQREFVVDTYFQVWACHKVPTSKAGQWRAHGWCFSTEEDAVAWAQLHCSGQSWMVRKHRDGERFAIHPPGRQTEPFITRLGDLRPVLPGEPTLSYSVAEPEHVKIMQMSSVWVLAWFLVVAAGLLGLGIVLATAFFNCIYRSALG